LLPGGVKNALAMLMYMKSTLRLLGILALPDKQNLALIATRTKMVAAKKKNARNEPMARDAWMPQKRLRGFE